MFVSKICICSQFHTLSFLSFAFNRSSDLRHSVALISVSSFASSSSFGFFLVCDNEYYSCIVVSFLFCLLLFVYFCFSSVKCNSRAINLTFLALAFVYLLRLLRFLFVLFVCWFDRTCGFCCFSVSFVWFLAKIIVPTGCFGCQLFSFVCVLCFRLFFSAEDVYNG